MNKEAYGCSYRRRHFLNIKPNMRLLQETNSLNGINTLIVTLM